MAAYLANPTASSTLCENNNVLAEDANISSTNRIVIEYEDTNIVYEITVIGDVNGDGIVDKEDSKRLAEYIVDNDSDLELGKLELGDMDDDGNIKMNDVIKLIKSNKKDN